MTDYEKEQRLLAALWDEFNDSEFIDGDNSAEDEETDKISVGCDYVDIEQDLGIPEGEENEVEVDEREFDAFEHEENEIEAEVLEPQNRFFLEKMEWNSGKHSGIGALELEPKKL